MKHFFSAFWTGLVRMATEPLQEGVPGKYSFTRMTGAASFLVAIFVVVFVAVTHLETPHYIWTVTALLAYAGGTKVVQKFAEK